MNRLRDQKASQDPIEVNCAKILSSAEPLDPNGIAERRVRASLLLNPSPRSRVAFMMRPVMAAAMVFALISIAAAAIVHERMNRSSQVIPTIANTAPIAAAPIAAPRIAAAPVAAEPAIPQPAAPSEAAQVATRPNKAPHAAKPKGPTAEESKLLMSGLKSLRVDHDPLKAGEQFERYLHRFPRGALFEEALAYGIEASALRKDPNTSALATRYLRKFPSGRFRSVAENAIKRAGN